MVVWDILAGLIMGTLTGMGIGGGGLLVLYLTGVRGMSQLVSQGCNLLFFVISSAAALFIHNRKRKFDFRLIGIAAALAVIGAQAGVLLSGVLPEETVRHLYGWMLVAAGTLSGVRLIFKK